MVIAKGARIERKSTVEIVDDGMILRFAFHQPRKIFFDPGLLMDFVDRYLDDIAELGEAREKTFEVTDFKLVFWKEKDVVRLVLRNAISGHKMMMLSQIKLIEDVRSLFAD